MTQSDWRSIAAMLAWSQTGEPHTEAEQRALDAYDEAVRMEGRDDHAPMLTSSRRDANWWCSCGAKGEGRGVPAVGWAQHVSDVAKEAANSSKQEAQGG